MDPHLHRALILTDGLANVGVTDPHALTVQASELRQRGITTSAMGVGAGFNEVLLSGMAEAGGGTFAYIGRPHELAAFFRYEVGSLLQVVAPQPRLRITFPEGMRGWLVNPFPARRVGRELAIDLRDMTAGDGIPLVFDIETSPGEVETTLALRMAIELPHLADATAEMRADVAPLVRARARDIGGHAPDEAVQVQAARLRADRAHRAAMRLDREGRVDEARHAFDAAVQTLAAAPATPEIVAERAEATRLLESAGRLSETTRKERVHRAMHRSRGQAPR
jgi:Ca-activated chloride channel family protein